MEKRIAQRIELGLGITRGSPRHIAAIKFSEIALAVHIRMQKRLIPARQADHRVIDGGVAVRVQPHGLADDIGAFRACGAQKAHLIHRIEQLAVAGFEAVDLRNRAAEDHAHRIGHVVLFEGIDNRLFNDAARALDHAVNARCGRLWRLFSAFWHTQITCFVQSVWSRKFWFCVRQSTRWVRKIPAAA